MDRLKQYQEMGATVTPIPKHMVVEGLVEMVEQLRQTVQLQQQLTERIVDTMANSGVQSADMVNLTQAIRSIKPEIIVPTTEQPQCDWEVSFERGQNGLMKSGVRFSRVVQ